jgi:dihydroorotase
MTIEGNIVQINKANKVFRGRIEIDDRGMISKIGSPTGAADFIFADELIFPGFIDLHVHAREDMSHTQEYKEDFKTAGEAAINGGVVAFLDMPNNPIAPIDDASYDAKLELTKKSPVTVMLYGGIGPHTRPLSKKVPYKVFMGHSVGDLFFTNSEDLEKVISQYKGQQVSFHCENPKILEENKDALTHEAKRPAVAEISAIDFAIELIEKYNLVGKICHASTVEGIEKIIAAKKRGVKITAEVTPHHLFFDETMLNGNRKQFQVNPPIRQTKENRLALIKFLKEGSIDYLATDHAPHSIEEKEKGMSGLTHLDTYGPFTTWLISEHGFTAEEIARVCAENPGNFMNEFLDDKYGKIEEGYVGSLTIIDPKKKIVITRDLLKTKCGWSPFLGYTFPGNVVATVIKGKVYKK